MSTSTASSRSSPRRANFPFRGRAEKVVALTTVALVLGLFSYAHSEHLSSQPVLAEAIKLPTCSLLPPGGEDLYKDPSTSVELPKRIPQPASIGTRSGDESRPFVLIASGVRTVSFLRVQVYVAALYVDEAAFRKFLASRRTIMGNNVSTAATATTTTVVEALLTEAVESGVSAVIRIVPVRNTNFAHLRDGFTRAIQQRKKQWRQQSLSSSLSSDVDFEALEKSLAVATQRFKECFPKTSLKKGSELDIVLHRSRAGGPGVDLALEHQGLVLGTVPYDTKTGDLDVARLLLGAYMAEKDPVSPVVSRCGSQKHTVRVG